MDILALTITASNQQAWKRGKPNVKERRTQDQKPKLGSGLNKSNSRTYVQATPIATGMVFTTYSKTSPTRNGWMLISTINQHAKKLKHVQYMNDEGFMYPE
jgi:thiamine monophosphate synthase